MKSPYKPTPIPVHSLAWERMIPRIGMAQAAVARFDGILQAMINPELLLSPLTTQEAVLSSRIEGTQASLEDVLRQDADPRKDAERKDDIREVQNYREALRHAVGWLRKTGIDLSVIRRIHKVLLTGVRGEGKAPGRIRTTQNYIGYRGEPIEKALFIPPEPGPLMVALADLSAFMATTQRDVIVQTALAHAQFELLHPFLDGNGRVGRILIPLLLHEKGLISAPTFYISEYFEEERLAYYDRLGAISSEGDWQGWVDFFLTAVTEQAELNTRRAVAILTIHIQGAVLSADILDRLAQGDLRGQKPTDFGLDGAVKDEIGRAWADVQDIWRIYQRRLERLKEKDRGTTETRNQWIVPLLGLLGYKLEYHQRGEVVDGRTYAISHRDLTRGGFPVHIMGHRDSLDRKREDGGPRMSPHALVQEFLNLTEHLYAIVTNGRQLRLLRDSTRLVKLSYIEFDLEQMVEESHFADFAVLFRILHASRMPLSSDHAVESLIEQYHQDALDSGSRIRDGLSKAVECSIIALANGFLCHRDNGALRGAIRNGELDARSYYQYQLRLIYRLLFLMVIEERHLVHPDEADRTKRDIYDQYYSVSNLRRLAGKRHLADSRHKDYWMALRNTFRLFGQEHYGAPLGIKPLAGDLFSADAIRHLNICSLDNRVLMACLTNLSVFEHPETRQRIRGNYAALNVEEFGSVYEGLLEYDARIAPNNGEFVFSLVKGDERASSGSHYKPDELVTPLIRHSLDHVISRKIKEAKAAAKLEIGTQQLAIEQALLSIKVCDVACGSGHILLNAARRIATELAIVRTGEDQPSPKALREAVRDVIRHCIYDVDLNPMAVELCKVALWLESHNPNAPLGFLDHHIKCGNAIVGLAHADELERGIPDEAFKRLPDDDKDVCALLRKSNKNQRKDRESGQQINYGERVGRDLRKVLEALSEVDSMPERTPNEVAAKQSAYDKWKSSLDRRNFKIVADMQVAQFFISKTPGMESRVVTDETYFRHLKGELQLIGPAVAEAMALAIKAGNRFFHWFLEFPEVFAKGRVEQPAKDTNGTKENGQSGFDCILGNPPYLGGQALSGTYGHRFCEWVRHEYAPTGLSDLVVFFLRRNYALLAPERFVSILTTNSIKDGNVRKDGLEVILDQGGSINFAVGSVKWPGRANLYVSLFSVFRGNWAGKRSLSGRTVGYISAFLEDYEEIGPPRPLQANADRMYQGTIFLGDGFLLEMNEATEMISYDARNHGVISPVINGQELNNAPEQRPGRMIIDFHDWAENRAREYGLPFQRVQRLVLPARQVQKDRTGRMYWWRHLRPRAELYSAIGRLPHCFAATRTTKYLNFSACPTDWVFLDSIYVYCSDSFAEYAVLQSTIHEAWARKYSGCLETRLRYSPTDYFENFPFPAADMIRALATVGEAYHDERKALMLQLNLGLTKTYNLFHTRDLTPDDVAKASKATDLNADAAYAAILALRQRHVEMDNAVLKAYGWYGEVDLAHDFYEVDYLPENDNIRFTISPAARREILQRLLQLNHERYAEEVAAGLHDKKTGKPANRKPLAVREAQSGYGQMELGM